MLFVKVTETDDSFEPLTKGYDYLVDFMDLSLPNKRPDREHSYLEVRYKHKKGSNVINLQETLKFTTAWHVFFKKAQRK